MAENIISYIYVDIHSEAYAAYCDILFSQKLPYIRARNVVTGEPNYLHAEMWIEQKPQDGIWQKVSIPHRVVHWILHNPDKHHQPGFGKREENKTN